MMELIIFGLIINFLFIDKKNIIEKMDDINVNNSLWIFNNFYSFSKFNKIKNYVSKMKFKYDNRVTGRKTICLPYKKNKELYKLIYNNNKLSNFIKKNYKNKKYKLMPRFPIEYRIYPQGSEGMHMHSDLQMTDPNQLEIVLTIENNSTSKFKWIENNKINKLHPKANTLVIVEPNGIKHGVSSVKKGYRTILKFIIEFEGSKKLDSYYREIDNCPI